MRTLTTTLLFATLTAACVGSSEPADHALPTPPGHGVRPIYNVPGGGAAAALFGPGGSFMLNGPTAPGSASFTSAPVTDETTPPTTNGTGALQITVDGISYAAPALETFAVLLSDGASPYVALVGYADRPGPNATTLIDEVIVIVPQAEAVAGATIALDGQDRVALFASGDSEADQPSVFAAAVTGTVTFGSGSATLGGTLSATVAGDFGSVDFVDPGTGTGGTLTDGSYTLEIVGPADVYCDGTLAGQESTFASITAASLGLGNGSVAIANSGLAISGAPIAAGFGLPSLDLSEVDSGLWAGFIDESVAGPAGTTRAGKYLVLDASSASAMFINGSVGAAYLTANQDGQCSVAFGATLTAP